MAKGNIKGINIEIGGDTTGLVDALKDVNKESSKTQSELKQVENALKLDPSNVELIRQKQELLTKSIQQTSEKLDTLKVAQSQVQAQFDRGDIGADQYRAFQRELSNTESALKSFEGQLNSMSSQQDRFADAQQRLDTYMQATGQSADDLASKLGTRLASAIRDGSASTDQMEMALQRLARQSGATGQDLNRFNDILRNSGKNNSLDEIRQDLDKLGKEADEAESSVSNLSGAIGGLVAGGGIGGTVATALNTTGLETKIEVTMEVPETSIKDVKEAVNSVTKYGKSEQEEALEAVRRQWALNADASDEANMRIIEGAGAVAAAYEGIDLIELVQETNEFAAALKISNEDALALTNSLLKAGFPPEQLDILSEYGTQMEAIGFSSAEIQKIFESGIDTKSWNIDNLNDGVKEARITMSEFGLEVDKSTAALLEGTGKSAADFQAWGKAVAGGGEQGSKAMGEVSEWLKTIEDDSLRNELAIKVFGTKAEDQVGNMISIFSGLSEAEDKSVQNLQGYQELVEGFNSDPMVQIRDAVNNMKTALSPLLEDVAQFIGKIAEWAAANPALTATIAAIVTVIGILVGLFAALMPAIGAVISAWPVIAAAFAAITAPVGVAIGAVAGIIAAVAALIAIGITLYKNWDSIISWLKKTWSTMKSNAVSAFTQTKASIVNTWSQIKNFLSNLWSSVKNLASSTFNSIKNTVVNVLKTIGSTFTTIWNVAKNSTVSTFNTVKSIISTVINTVKGVITAGLQLIQGNWKGAFNTLKTTASNMVSSILTIFKGTNLFKVGKEIIQGLINGISNMKEAALNAIAGVANGVIKKAKSLLKIFSPSKEFHGIGEMIGKGWANGITASQKLVDKAVSNVAKVIKNTAKKNAAAVTAIEKAAEKERNAVRKEYAKKRAELKKKDSKTIAKLEQELATKIKKINTKAAKDIAAVEKKLNDEKLAAIENYIKNKKELNELSLFEEAQYYRAAANQFKKNSSQQTTMQNAYKDTVNTINNEIVSINNDYLKRTQDINTNLIKNEEDLNKKYEDAFQARYQTILGYYGLFDEVKEREAVNASEIIGNLQDQIIELNTWRNQLARLQAKGISDTLLEDLRGMGPSILSQLEALNQMTDEELGKYQRLYEEKMLFATITTTNELKPLKESTKDEIVKLRNTANDELTQLNVEWQQAIYNVVRGTEETFTTLQQVGKNAAQNLIDGLSGMESSLLKKAKEIATSVSNAINSALNISGNANIGASVTASLNSASTSLNDANAQTIANTNSTDTLKVEMLASSILKLAKRPIQTNVNLDGKTIANVVSSLQYDKTSITALTKGVSL